FMMILLIDRGCRSRRSLRALRVGNDALPRSVRHAVARHGGRLACGAELRGTELGRSRSVAAGDDVELLLRERAQDLGVEDEMLEGGLVGSHGQGLRSGWGSFGDTRIVVSFLKMVVNSCVF